jgi:hypothetical protein
MKLFWQKQQHPKPVIPPELQPYYGHGSNGGWRRFILPGLIVVGLLIIGVIIWKIIDMNTSGNTERRDDYIQAPQDNPSLNGQDRKPAQTDSSNSTNNKPIEL